MSNQTTLTELADEHGSQTPDSTDSITPKSVTKTVESDSTEVPPPSTPTAVAEEHVLPDGHVPGIDTIPEYWQQTESDSPRQRFLPPGKLYVVLKPALFQNGRPTDEPLTDGVYLPGKPHIGSRPPKPMDISDAHLAFTAQAGLRAARRISKPVVGIGVEHTNLLNVYVDDSNIPRQQYVFQGGDGKSPNSADTVAVDLEPTFTTADGSAYFCGFPRVRIFGLNDSSNHAGHEIYTKATEPRLPISAVRP